MQTTLENVAPKLQRVADKQAKLQVARLAQARDILLAEQLKGIDLQWTGPPPQTTNEVRQGQDYAWYLENGKLGPHPCKVNQDLCSHDDGKGGEYFKGGLVIKFEDEVEVCVARKHIAFRTATSTSTNTKRRKFGDPVEYLVIGGTYKGHHFVCMPNAVKKETSSACLQLNEFIVLV